MWKLVTYELETGSPLTTLCWKFEQEQDAREAYLDARDEMDGTFGVTLNWVEGI